jgi:hypothetical protein
MKATINVEIKHMPGNDRKFYVEIFWREENKRFVCEDKPEGMNLYEAQHVAYVMRDNLLTQ